MSRCRMEAYTRGFVTPAARPIHRDAGTFAERRCTPALLAAGPLFVLPIEATLLDPQVFGQGEARLTCFEKGRPPRASARWVLVFVGEIPWFRWQFQDTSPWNAKRGHSTVTL